MVDAGKYIHSFVYIYISFHFSLVPSGLFIGLFFSGGGGGGGGGRFGGGGGGGGGRFGGGGAGHGRSRW